MNVQRQSQRGTNILARPWSLVSSSRNRSCGALSAVLQRGDLAAERAAADGNANAEFDAGDVIIKELAP